MRIILTSDWHLGKALYNLKLLPYQSKFFHDQFLGLLRDVNPDLLIVAGDILDKPLPDQETLFYFEEFLRELSYTKVKSIFILGNHDSRRTALHKHFMEYAAIYIIDDLKYLIEPFVVRDSQGNTLNLYLFPYLPPFELMNKLGHYYSRAQEAANPLREALWDYFADKTLKDPAILVGHFAIEEAVPSGEELLLRGFSNEYLFPKDLFSPFKYLFLGHLHRYQTYSNKFIYSGAPLPYSFEIFSERRGVLLVEFNEGIISHLELIPLEPPYILKIIKGSFESICSLPEDESYVKVILEEDKPIFDVHAKLKKRFPNLLYLDYVSPQSERDVHELFIEGMSQEDTQLELKILFREFYQLLEKRGPEEELWQIFETYLDLFNQKEQKEGMLCH